MAGNGTTCVVLSLLATVLSVCSLEPLVDLPAGPVRGTVLDVSGTQVNAYLGIPYAKPPVGELRFKPPVPPDPWQGVYNATEMPRSCYQKLGLYNPTDRSEDCLYVNVWQPPSRPHYGAVMVWIHGGGFVEGSGTGGDRGVGRFLAATEHVIVVSMNYRLGALGFLALGTDDAPGNMGLLDQQLALQWVQDNIERFGGNPDRVTIFGNSAGGASAHFHLLSPSSSSLYQRAILQSGAAFCNWALTPRDVAMARGRALGSALGCRQPEVQDMVACLQSRSAEDIVNNQPQALLDFGFTPVVDGNFLPSHPSDMAEERPPPTVDVMAGFTTNEGSLFIARETSLGFNRSTDSFINKNQYIKTIQALLPTLNEFGTDAVAFEYTDWRGLDNPAVYRDAAENMVGDYSFKCPVIEASLARARVGGKVYMYQFNHVVSTLPPPPWTGAQHTSEIAMVFGLPLDSSQNYTPDEDRLSRTMMRFWTNFAKTGDPNDPGTETWPPYNQTDQSYIVLDTQPVRVAQWPRTRPCAFWREYLWQLQEQTDVLLHNQAAATGGQPRTAHLPTRLYVHVGLGFLLKLLFQHC
ncbi:PREDICTED: cholinesterase 2-like [Branchiostoma belcheri]|uniref:Carboxylic ester hydrolase n=1 Tax=Branchiostoma belcheri TaxID=7741 RepID=A0A6P4ZRQ9_BRABE|nr:PREDICTED: cholinesterase 2-like [Branchiostoma belcheri]